MTPTTPTRRETVVASLAAVAVIAAVVVLLFVAWRFGVAPDAPPPPDRGVMQ